MTHHNFAVGAHAINRTYQMPIASLYASLYANVDLLVCFTLHGKALKATYFFKVKLSTDSCVASCTACSY